MDPRERADATLARARARGAFVVTPESAVSPMDAASTVQIPRTVVSANDERRADDPDATMVVPAPLARGGAREENLPAIAQEAMTDVVSSPPGIRSRQRRLEDAERARQAQQQRQQQAQQQAQHQVPPPAQQQAQQPTQPVQPPHHGQPPVPQQHPTPPTGQPAIGHPPAQQHQQQQPAPPPQPAAMPQQPAQQQQQQQQQPAPQPEQLDGLIPTTKPSPSPRSSLSQRLDG